MPVETSFRRFQKLLRFVAKADLAFHAEVKICFVLLPICTDWNLNQQKLRQIDVSRTLSVDSPPLARAFQYGREWNQMFHTVVLGHVFGVHPPGSNCGYESLGR
jgi:hypothetical protein